MKCSLEFFDILEIEFREIYTHHKEANVTIFMKISKFK
jgi:hypothetical protein